LVSASF